MEQSCICRDDLMKIRPGKILKSLYHMSSAFVADFISNDMMHLRDLLELPHHSTGLCRALLIEALAKRGITCSCLMELIRGQEIKKLSLKDGRLLDNETHFVSIVELAGSGLLEIDVRNLTVFQSFATLFSNTPLQSPSKTHYFDSLIRFDARDCLSITDDDIQTLVSILPNLHIFLLAGCLSLTDIAIHFITSSKFMQTSLLEFDISRLELSMEALTSLDALSNIEVLSMAQVVTEASCCSVSPAHRLKGLDMSRSSILTSDHIQEVLSIQMKSLRYLNLAETVVSGSSLLIAFHAAIIACQSLAREAGVVGGTVASACESGDNHSLALDTLDLSWCEQASGEALASLFSYTPHLSRLYLRSSLANSSTVVSLSSACTCLTELNLSRCEEVDDVAAHALAAMSNPQLRWLDISWSLITDDGVSSVLRAHKYIQVLSLQGCKSLTVATVDLLTALAESHPSIQPDLAAHPAVVVGLDGPGCFCDSGLVYDSPPPPCSIPPLFMHRPNVDEPELVPALHFLDLSWVNMLSKELAIQLTSGCRTDLSLLDYYGEVYQRGKVVADFL